MVDCRHCVNFKTSDYTPQVCRTCGIFKDNFKPSIREIPNKETVKELGERKLAPKNNIKENKPKPSLIPLDILMEVLEPAYKVGLKKYEKESWRKGFLVSDMIDAALRHISKFYYEGEDFDQEDLKEFGITKHHIGGAIFSLISAYHSITKFSELDDRIIEEIEE